MDPVTIGAVLLAIVSGAGGGLGSQLWAGVSALVRRLFHRQAADEETAASVPSGEAELAALERAPSDKGGPSRWRRCWWRGLGPMRSSAGRWRAGGSRPSLMRTGEGNVTNTISGGTQYGPVLQGRDFAGLTSVPPRLTAAGSAVGTADSSA